MFGSFHFIVVVFFFFLIRYPLIIADIIGEIALHFTFPESQALISTSLQNIIKATGYKLGMQMNGKLSSTPPKIYEAYVLRKFLSSFMYIEIWRINLDHPFYMQKTDKN